MLRNGSICLILALSLFATLASPRDTSASVSANPSHIGTADVQERYTGTIVGVGGAAGGRTWSFTMNINGYTSQGEALEYAQILQSQGQDDLLKAISKRDLGTFSVAGQIGRTLNFVYQVPSDGGRRIIALFDRWESTWEHRSGSRTLDYPFTYVEFSVDSKGKGSGTVIPLAKVFFDKKDANLVNIENFGVYPLRLVNVERE
jgi:hypothetical protein